MNVNIFNLLPDMDVHLSFLHIRKFANLIPSSSFLLAILSIDNKEESCCLWLHVVLQLSKLHSTSHEHQ